jgi:hypothetical protein
VKHVCPPGFGEFIFFISNVDTRTGQDGQPKRLEKVYVRLEARSNKQGWTRWKR